MLITAEMEKKVRSFYGLPPYDKGSFSYMDGYVAVAFKSEHGIEIEEAKKQLQKEGRL